MNLQQLQQCSHPEDKSHTALTHQHFLKKTKQNRMCFFPFQTLPTSCIFTHVESIPFIPTNKVNDALRGEAPPTSS